MGFEEREREREKKREKKREREWFGEQHPFLCFKPCFAFDSMSSWYNAAGYGWSGPCGSWSARRRGSWLGRSEVRSEDEWFCQKCNTGNCWSRMVCRHSASVTNEAAEPPQTSTQEKINILEKTRVGMGNEEPILAGRKVLEKELERHQKKLDGPKNTTKQIEAKQNWITRETKRIEAEVEKLTEMQENIKTRKTLRVAYEEIMKLRTDLAQEGESMDKKQEPRPVSGECGGSEKP